MGFWKNLTFQEGFGKALDPFGLTPLGKDKEDEPRLPPPPEYHEDPDYRQMQDFLKQYGTSMLEGKPNEYYGEMGAYGSPEFEKVLGLTTRDIQQSSAEAAARAGRGRGGYLPSITAQRVGDTSAKLRYADYLKAMQGRQFLLSQGRGITEGVRGAGGAEGARRNVFNLQKYGLERENTLFDINRGDMAAGAQGDFLSNLFQIGSGAVVGGMTGGVPGAIIGAAGGVGSLAQSGALDKLFDMGGTKTTALTSATPGVSSLGKIKSDSDIDSFLAQYSNRFKN